MYTKLVVFVLLGISKRIYGATADSNQFSADVDDIQLKEISENVRRVTGAVMGLTEYVMDIRDELQTIKTDIAETKATQNITTLKVRPESYFSRPARDPEEMRRQSLELADKVEKLLAMDQSPEVDLAKEELKRTVEKNFLRMLAAILITGPAHTQERSDDIFKLMRSVLNGELDFTPVVQRLPLILRDSETNQFVNLLITLRESERGNSFRQGQGLLNSIDTLAQVHANNRQILSSFPSFPTRAQQLLTNPIQAIQNAAAPILGNFQPANNNNNLPTSSQAVVSTNQNGQQVVANGVQQQLQPQQQQLQQQQQPQFNQNLNQNLNPNYNPNYNPNLNNPNIPQNPNLANDPTNQLPSINSILDGLTQTNQLIKEIPTLVEGLQTIVESIEGLFG